MTITITVPAIPAGLHPAACWRRTLTGLNAGERGMRAVAGDWLHAGDSITAEIGTLLLTVDKTTTGWDTHYQTGERFPVEDATITAYLVTTDGLSEVWRRHFKQAKSAFGAASLKKLGTLLAQHPAPGKSAAVVEEAHRPNRQPGSCRWCGGHIGANFGHVTGHGDNAKVEHWKSCPRRRATNGTPCTLCGVSVCADDAEQVLTREGEGRWETRHRTLLNCTEYAIPSWEEMQQQRQAERDAERKREEKREKDRQNRAAKKNEKEEQQAAAHAAEQERIQGLATMSRTSQELYSKSLGAGGRVRLLQHSDILEDGSTTLRWTVETSASGTGWTGDDYDPDLGHAEPYTTLEAARRAYQAMKFELPRRTQPTGPACSNCDRPGARHPRYDSSGIKGLVCNSCNRDEDYMLSFA